MMTVEYLILAFIIELVVIMAACLSLIGPA